MIVNIEGENIKLPDFLIVGAAKSGTTSLYYYLRQHPDIFLSEVKEPYFFSFMDKPPAFVIPQSNKKLGGIFHDLGDYVKLFYRASDIQVAGEASTWYLYYHETTIENIKRVYGIHYKELKIIIVLRNPIERLWSHYCMQKREGSEPLPLEEAVRTDVVHKRIAENYPPGYDYVGFGKYYEQVKAFLEEFPEVRAFLFDELESDSPSLLKEIFGFLDVDTSFLPHTENRYNVSGEPKGVLSSMVAELYKPNILKDLVKPFVPFGLRQRMRTWLSGVLFEKKLMNSEQREMLKGIFAEDVERLGRLLGKDLRFWLDDD